MNNNYLLLLLLTCSFFGAASEASLQSEQHLLNSFISVENAYIRSLIPGSSVTSLYMSIENKGEKTVTLLGATSKISPRIEIHQHSMSEGMMRMRQIDSIDIKAKQRIFLQPSGLHLMFFDVKNSLRTKKNIELTLNFLNRASVIIQVPVYGPIQEKRAQEAIADSAKSQPHHH